jgi:sodium leak channel non-selective protein
MEWIFLICMTVELGIKACARGLIFTPNAILASSGGVIDFLVWIGSIGTIFLPPHVSRPSFGYKLLCLRCIRPVRIFKLLPPVRKVAKECLSGWKEILMVSVILSVLLFVFAAFGVVLFGDGKLKKCNDFSIDSAHPENCTGFFSQKILVSNELHLNNDVNPRKLMVPRAFTNPRNFNFDTMQNSMLTLFEVLSLKGWVEVRDVMINRIEPWWVPLIYIHIFAVLGWLIGLTLFIGVVVANYNENKGTALLTVDQRRWEDLSRRLRIVQPLHQPPRPENEGLQARCYDISQHTTFKRTIAFCVLANSFLLSLKWEGDEAKYLAFGHCAVSVIFILEVIIKLVGMGFKGMCESFRNLADMCMAVFSIPWMIVFIVTYETPDMFQASMNETMRIEVGKPAVDVNTMAWWRETNYKYGVTMILTRFLFICGKHVSPELIFAR